MAEYGKTPLADSSGTGLGIGFVRLNTNGQGTITTHEYWNHAIADWEAAPRVDAKHVLPYQRLSDVEGDVDGEVQFAAIPKKAMASTNVVAVTYNLDSAGKAVGVQRVAERNMVTAMAAINHVNY